ncbi:MAG: hypothetical protein KDK69_05645 [Chlamydiia bacterium]|nr:hypothetical protein [Chlamydiia bacterium]
MVKSIVAGIIGGIIAFVWGFVSWMVLPWHNEVINKFQNQEFVSWVIKENVTKDGVYMAPYAHGDQFSMTPDDISSEMKQQDAALKKGPYVFAQVRVNGVDMSSPLPYIYSFLTQFVAIFFVSFLMLKMVDTTYGGRLFFVTMIGLLAGIIALVPNWNWFGAGYRFTLVMMADYVVQWFLVGLFLAGFARPKPEREHELMM